jgi:gas vesicle protein
MTDPATGDLIAATTPEPSASPQAGAAGSPTAAAGGPPPQDGQQSGDLIGDGAAGKDTSGPLSGDGNGGDEGGVPDAYTFEPPEGVELNDELKAGAEAFASTAKEMGLTQAQYQKLIEYDIQRTTQAVGQATEQWTETVSGWRESVKVDKELGGRNLTQTLQTVESAVQQFGDADLRALLRSPSPENPNGMSIGNHPAVVRFLNRVGRAIADPSLITGEAQAPMTPPEQRMYPSMFQK